MKKIFFPFSILLAAICMFLLSACAHTHQYTATLTEPGCETQGYTTYTCACGDSYVAEPVEPSGHLYVAEVVPPTCTASGYTSYTCRCGKGYTDDYVGKLKHHYVVEIIPPTCMAAGYTAYTCACGDSYTEDPVVDPSRHPYTAAVTRATCKSQGYTTYTCVCGESYVDDYTDISDHAWGTELLHDATTGLSYRVCGDCSIMKTELPVIHINTDNKGITKNYVDAVISITNCDDAYLLNEAAAQVKVRGNGTAKQAKKPYRIKFNKKQVMLGLNNNLKAKSWVLLAEYNDKSFARNYTALTFARELFGTDGYYSSDFLYVEVYINSKYNGVYLLAEQQQVNASRVDINEVEEGYTGTDIGYFLELDEYAKSEDHYFTLNYKLALTGENGKKIALSLLNPLYAIKSDIYSDAQKKHITKHMQHVYDVVYDAVCVDHSDLNLRPYKTLNADSEIVVDRTITSALECVERLIDLDSLVDTFLLNEIMLDTDVGWSSFYMSVDLSATGDRLLTFEAPWDFDWGLTCYDHMLGVLYSCNYHNFYTAATHVNPWLVILSNENWFWEMARARWAEFRNSNVVDVCCLELEAYTQIMEQNFNGNFEVWSGSLTVGGKNSSTFIACKNQKEASELVVEYLKKRIRNLDRIFEYNSQYSQ